MIPLIVLLQLHYLPNSGFYSLLFPPIGMTFLVPFVVIIILLLRFVDNFSHHFPTYLFDVVPYLFTIIFVVVIFSPSISLTPSSSVSSSTTPSLSLFYPPSHILPSNFYPYCILHLPVPTNASLEVYSSRCSACCPPLHPLSSMTLRHPSCSCLWAPNSLTH